MYTRSFFFLSSLLPWPSLNRPIYGTGRARDSKTCPLERPVGTVPKPTLRDLSETGRSSPSRCISIVASGVPLVSADYQLATTHANTSRWVTLWEPHSRACVWRTLFFSLSPSLSRLYPRPSSPSRPSSSPSARIWKLYPCPRTNRPISCNKSHMSRRCWLGFSAT